MPSFEDVQQYLTGATRMMLGRADGLRMLDLSADGFWNSFFAIVVALPALMVGWVGLANDLDQATGGMGNRLSILLRIAFIDLAAWTGPLVLLALIIAKTPIANRFVPIVIASNWASAVTVWLMVPAPLLRLAYPAAVDAASLLSLVLFAISMVLTWRLTNIAVARGPAVASAVFSGMLIASMAVLFLLQTMLGLDRLAQLPGG